MRGRLTALAGTAAAIMAVAVPAQAHTRVISKSPRSSASAALSAVSVTFSQQVRSGTLRVYRGRRQVSSGSGRLSFANVRRVGTRIVGRLSRGTYLARWSIVAADGHRQRGSWTFRVR